jgi:hypothetical protein
MTTSIFLKSCAKSFALEYIKRHSVCMLDLINSEEGKKCFILGNRPSLADVDTNILN